VVGWLNGQHGSLVIRKTRIDRQAIWALFFLSTTLLNSRLITFYARIKNIIKREKGKQPQIRLGDLKKIPIYDGCESEIHFNNLGRILLFDYDRVVDSVLDGLVFELYFSDHMKEKQIDILQFVEKDLAEVMQDREFEQLSDSEKKA